MSRLNNFFQMVNGNRLSIINATGLSSISLDFINFDVFNINSIQTGATIDMSTLPVGSTAVIIFNNPGVISILYSEAIKWPYGAAPVHGTGWEIMVFTRISSTVLLGSFTLGHA